MALNYARRFGRSAPAWAVVSQPLVAHAAGVAKPAPAAVAAGQRWDSPVVLDDVAVARLRTTVKPGATTYVLNWRPVQQMSPSAASGLAELLAAWCDMPLMLCFEGIESLDRLLHTHTPSGDRSVSRHLWQLRFDALRLMRQQDDYELAALEFCVTFEVSPPPWREPRCQRVDGPQARSLPLSTQTTPAEASPVVALAPGSHGLSNELALSGEVWGDVSGIVAQWQLAAGDRSIWLVSCTGLIRVDFSAAGGLLNWVTQVTAQGSRVEFRDVPRLVAAFFHLIGINEHARVTARTN
jgi:ABC-type transporter Mla MlaB component